MGDVLQLRVGMMEAVVVTTWFKVYFLKWQGMGSAVWLGVVGIKQL